MDREARGSVTGQSVTGEHGPNPAGSKAAPPGSACRYLFTGGGTGGHVYPALAIADFIRASEPESKFLFVGARGGSEERIVPSRGYTLRALRVRGLPTRKSGPRILGVLARLATAVLQAAAILLRFKPQAVIGTGGYASAPILLAALVLRPLRLWRGVVAIQEQNIVPGRFNLWACRWVDFVGVSFPETGRFFPGPRVRLTGYPLRNEMERESLGDHEKRALGRAQLGIPPHAKVLLVFGGSSGARALNRVLLETLSELLAREDLYIFHATGYQQGAYDPQEEARQALSALPDRGAWRERYRSQPYYDHMETYYRVSDLVVSRGGAGTVWEIASAARPAILVPKSNLPGDHQVKNARFLERHGTARVLFERRASATSKTPGQDIVDAEEFLREALLFLYGQKNDDHTGKKVVEVPRGALQFYEAIRSFADGTGAGDPGARPREHRLPTANSRGNARPGIEWYSDAQLVPLLENKWKRQENLTDPDRRYIENRIGHLLCAPTWQRRNLAVKLIGLTRSREHLPFLLHCISDRSPAPFLHRLLGGDFREVGFIRRNALQAVWRIHEYNAEVRRSLLLALHDPYFEVRSWASRAVTFFSEAVGHDPEIERLLRENLKDQRFEVIAYSLEPLGRVSRDPGILKDLLPLLEHKNWKIQEAAVRCLADLLERKVIELTDEIEKELQRIPMKGLDFFPQFPLEQTWESFLRNRTKPAGDTHEPSP